MGLFDRKRKTDKAVEQQSAEAETDYVQTIDLQVTEPQAGEQQVVEEQATEHRSADTQATGEGSDGSQEAEPQPAGVNSPDAGEADAQTTGVQTDDTSVVDAQEAGLQPTDAESSAALPVAEAQASDFSISDAQSAAERSDVDQPVQPAAEWSDGDQLADQPANQLANQSADLAAEQAMSAPSLESVIVTKSRDLSRLSREDLLQLLLTQSKDAERLQDYLRDVADEFERCTSLNARLREKLDAKDEQIERLKGRLDDKDKRIALMQARLDELEVSKEEEQRHARIIANAAKGVRSALEAFNATADWYIASLQEVCGDLDGQPARATAATSSEGGRGAAAWAAVSSDHEAETPAKAPVQAADGSQDRDAPSPVSPADNLKAADA
ncbi:hypothetical protein [Adlercreutzia sp. ZJ473]|uniref:hypothetical protein n=1 Tax=Adlercreutzia sp. ZJ473 TaxID=2722822 RepID=UPI0015516F2B|nr:hypothetical protein [Adlercreutzia sp. ZJ473]